MKSLLLIPAVLLVATSASWGVAKVSSWNPHPRDLIGAAAICCLAGEIALLPAVLLRKADAATLSQAALGGSVIHMFATILLFFTAWLGKIVIDVREFLFLMLAFYWLTLIALVMALAKLLRTAARSIAPHTQLPTNRSGEL